MAYSSCTLPGLAGVYGSRDDEGGVEIQFNLEAKRAGSPHIVKSSKDCCCFCQSSVYVCSTGTFILLMRLILGNSATK